MKMLHLLLISIITLAFCSVSAQTAEEIISTYIERTGGRKAWKDLKTLEIRAKLKLEGHDVPVTIYSTKNGERAILINYQVLNITQLGYDGTILWTTDLNTLKPRISDFQKTRKMELRKNDFPSVLLNYKENNYEVKYVGDEEIEGLDTYKVAIVQEPITINDIQIPTLSYFYFDKETYLPVLMKTIEPDGNIMTVEMSDYRKVEGLGFAFNLVQDNQNFIISEIILNPVIDQSIFTFPAQPLPDE